MRRSINMPGRAAGVARLLPQARKQRQPRFGRKPRQSPIPPALAIENRPERIGKREKFGHWEGGLIIFRRDLGKANIATIVERQTRYTLLLRNPDRRARPLADVIMTLLQPLPARARQSITFEWHRIRRVSPPRHRAQRAGWVDPNSKCEYPYKTKNCFFEREISGHALSYPTKLSFVGQFMYALRDKNCRVK